MSDAISRRAFAEHLGLLAAAPWLLGDLDLVTPPAVVPPPQGPEPSAQAKAFAEAIRLRYPDRFSAEELATITRGIDNRLRQLDRLARTALTNADEPDFVYAVYRGAEGDA